MAREGSFTHVRRELRPRAGIPACMVTGGGVLLMLGASSGQGVILGCRLMGISACMPLDWSLILMLLCLLMPRAGIYLHAWSWEGEFY